jgi:probable HAF family extracellular repeat protein
MRRTVKILLSPLAIACLVAGLPISSDGQAQVSGIRYAVTDLGTLGGSSSEAWGINDAGQVVGRADIPPTPVAAFYHAFLYDNGVMTDLGTINCVGQNSWAYDINDAGQIVGWTCSSYRNRAFLRSGGVMVDLGTLGGTHSVAFGINHAGHVVGTAATTGDATQHAFLYDGVEMHDLGTLVPNQQSSIAYDINDTGNVVGSGEGTPPPQRFPHAFLYKDGLMTDLTPGPVCCSWAAGINNADKVVGQAFDSAFLYSSGTMTNLGNLPNAAHSEAIDINNHDQIVGRTALGYAYWHAFRYENGVMIDLNDHIPDNPEWDLNVATAINDAGQIVGYGTIGGRTHAFLLTPVPTAVNDEYATGPEVPLIVPAPGVLANDTNVGTGWMVAEVVAPPAHGTLVLNSDGGFTYTPASGYIGPDTFTYRAANVHAPSGVATVSLSVTIPRPGALAVQSVEANLVTLRWSPPPAGPILTGHSVEGGVNPGEVLAAIPTGSPNPIYTFVAPAGSFYVRVHALYGPVKSAPSNEIRLFVNVPVRPSPPVNLVSAVNGSTVNLSWRNTFGGGAPRGVILEALLGATVFPFSLGLTESFAIGGVPAGTYTVRVRTFNAAGSSDPSNEVVVTAPSVCSGPPGPPANFLSYNVGRTIYVMWDPPITGSAATVYDVIVTGAYVGSLSTASRTLSGTVGPGSYSLSVAARNTCGTSAATPPQTVVIP